MSERDNRARSFGRQTPAQGSLDSERSVHSDAPTGGTRVTELDRTLRFCQHDTPTHDPDLWTCLAGDEIRSFFDEHL